MGQVLNVIKMQVAKTVPASYTLPLQSVPGPWHHTLAQDINGRPLKPNDPYKFKRYILPGLYTCRFTSFNMITLAHVYVHVFLR